MQFRNLLLLALPVSMLAGVFSDAAFAQDSAGEIALSDESLQLRYLQSEAGVAGGATSELGFGLFLNENRDIVASAHYYVEADSLRFDRLTLKAGPIAYAAMLNTENTDVFAMAIGVELRYEFLRRMGLDFVARGAYAPDILTFGAADNLWNFVARAEMPFADRITGFAGYRLFEIESLEGDRELEEALHIGVRYEF